MTHERLADLDELVLRCRTENAREYIREAVASYRAGAYRASIVTTWVAVVYDTVEKIRELSLSGDKEAIEYIRKFDSIQEAHRQGDPQSLSRSLELERNLLSEAATTFELISPNEMIDLERLREDRHRCAHPSMNTPEEPYRPTAELSRLHLRNAIVHVLHQPPVQGKSAFGLLERELASEYFPTRAADAETVLAEGPLARPRRNLLDLVVRHCVDRIADRASKPLDRDRYLAALNALNFMHRQVAQECLEKKVNTLMRGASAFDLRYALGLVAGVEGGWMLLNASSRTKLENFVHKDDDVPRQRYFPKLVNIEFLRKHIIERIEILDVDRLANVIENGGGDLCVGRATDLFCKSQNWSEANIVASKIVVPLAELFSADQIEEIVRSPKEKKSDLIGSGGMYQFVLALCKRGDLAVDWLKNMLVENGFEYIAEQIDEMLEEEDEA